MQRWENPLTSRYYQAAVQQNLFGDWELVRVWGGIASARGQVQWAPVESALAGQVALAAIAVRRAQRGYRRVDEGEKGQEGGADTVDEAALDALREGTARPAAARG